VSLNELMREAGVELRGPGPWIRALRGGGDHTLAILITLAAERANRFMPASQTRRALAAAESLREEVGGILGDDAVLLHQPHPRVAPRHNATIGRPWVVTPAAVFNLLGCAVTQVPLGLNDRGLPLGVQVAARGGNDHLTIAAALALERSCGGWVQPPR
jgi:fatty acid amide hydrolase 2